MAWDIGPAAAALSHVGEVADSGPQAPAAVRAPTAHGAAAGAGKGPGVGQLRVIVLGATTGIASLRPR